MLCVKAHAKINWSLDILSKRSDGYHMMDMLMQTVELHDTLWMEDSQNLTLEDAVTERSNLFNAAHHCDTFSSSEVLYDQTNLVYKAALRLREFCKASRGARMLLEKHIPSGAGMGGGSADAAAALIGLNELWDLHLNREELLEIGLNLGADVPFTLTGGLARVGGIGENITPLSPPPTIWLVLLQPCGGLSTKEIFHAYDALSPGSICHPDTDRVQKALLERDFSTLAQSMHNVLEPVSIRQRPPIRQAAERLVQAGAVRAMMTGSGSVVYGVFSDREKAEHAYDLLSAHEKAWLTQTENSDCNHRINIL